MKSPAMAEALKPLNRLESYACRFRKLHPPEFCMIPIDDRNRPPFPSLSV
jgi:hypothetical protein